MLRTIYCDRTRGRALWALHLCRLPWLYRSGGSTIINIKTIRQDKNINNYHHWQKPCWPPLFWLGLLIKSLYSNFILYQPTMILFFSLDLPQMQSWSDVTEITSESAARNPRNLLQKISFQNSSNTPNNQSVVFSSGSGEFLSKRK